MNANRKVVLSGVGIMIVTNIVGLIISESRSWEVGVQILFPVALFGLVYFALSTHMDSMTESIGGIKTHINTYLRAPVYETDSGRVRRQLEEVVDGANEFIYAVGGRARDEVYLDAIEAKVKAGTDYIRIVCGDHMQHALHSHLERLMATYDPSKPDSAFRLRWYLDERFGHFTVCESDVVISASNPKRRSPLQSILRIRDETVARQYKEHAKDIYSEAVRVDRNSPLLTNLCSKCSPVKNQVQELRARLTELLTGSRDSLC